MISPKSKPNRLESHWGEAPWTIEFKTQKRAFPEFTDFAVIGAGFTGLAAAAWLRRLAPEKSVVVFEAGRIGAGASGRTGGIALAETAAGDFPGLGDVLAGFQKILRELNVECDLQLGGAFEIGRSKGQKNSPIEWNDSGNLRVVHEVPGGTLDPGKLVSGLARAAESAGATIFENTPVEKIDWPRRENDSLQIRSPAGTLRVEKILFATNALSLALAGLGSGMHPRLTLAAITAPVSASQLAAIGLASRKPFYTIDLSYLWGRVCRDNSIIWGAGLVSAPDEKNVAAADVASQESRKMFESLERRVRALHPALRDARFTRRWGGPILFRNSWTPVFDWHPASRRAIVLGAYAGHGVALSSYLGRWSSEVFLGSRELPNWGRIRV
jgi:glycine/D-amino acid oxidase-like deaminating enzyme